MDQNIKIIVVYGGISTEREVSLRSGEAVYHALINSGLTNVELFDLKSNNISALIDQKPDLVYLALHGKGGEDGSIQGALELSGIPYTGPDVATSAICMNKIFTKHMLKALGIPTANYIAYDKSECNDRERISDQIIKNLGLPVVLKSPCQGSSIGVIIVYQEDDMLDAIGTVFSYGNQLLAEEFLEGTEITIPIIGNDEITVLPEIEITSERDFYDFTAKYTPGLCHHIIPSRITEKERETAIKIAERTYKKIGCKGVSRIDLIIDKDRGPMVIEINTLPGMTEMSLVPDSARAYGLSFPELVTRIAEFGLEAFPK